MSDTTIDIKKLAESAYREFETAQAEAEHGKLDSEDFARKTQWQNGKLRLVVAIGADLYTGLGVEQVEVDKFAFVIDDMRWNLSHITLRGDQHWRIVCYQIDGDPALLDARTIQPGKRPTLFTGDIRAQGASMELYKPLLVAIGGAPREQAKLEAERVEAEARQQRQLEIGQQQEAEERAALAVEREVDSAIRATLQSVLEAEQARLWRWTEGVVVTYYRLTYLTGTGYGYEDDPTFDYEHLWTLTDEVDERGYITGYEYAPKTVKIDTETHRPVFERCEARALADLPACWVREVRAAVPGFMLYHSNLKLRYQSEQTDFGNYLYRPDAEATISLEVGNAPAEWFIEQTRALFGGAV